MCYIFVRNCFSFLLTEVSSLSPAHHRMYEDVWSLYQNLSLKYCFQPNLTYRVSWRLCNDWWRYAYPNTWHWIACANKPRQSTRNMYTRNWTLVLYWLAILSQCAYQIPSGDGLRFRSTHGEQAGSYPTLLRKLYVLTSTQLWSGYSCYRKGHRYIFYLHEKCISLQETSWSKETWEINFLP